MAEKMKNMRMRRFWRGNFPTYFIVIIGYVVLMLLKSANMLSYSITGFLVPICAYIVMAVSLNLTVGIMGELSLGHAGFMSIGAYLGAMFSSTMVNLIPIAPLRLALSMLVGGVVAGAASLIVVVPVLRLRGDYLAIVTLAFGEIIRNIMQCLYFGIDEFGLHLSFANEAALNLAEGGRVIVRGPMGIVGIQEISTLTAGFVLVMVTLFVVLNLIRSRHGRAIIALRDNRIAAEAVGISTAKYKIIAFVTSAVFAGMAGSLYAMNFTSIVAKKFDFNTSILILLFVVLGGMGNIRGSVIAAAAMTILPELLRDYADYRMMVYAVVLIAVMLITNNPKIKPLIENFRARLRSKTGKGSSQKEGMSHGN